MRMTDLPTELSILIATFLQKERDINNLTQVNKKLYYDLNWYLYKHNYLHGNSSALRWAAKYGEKSTAVMSMRERASITSIDKYNMTPLSWAAAGGHIAIVELLLKSAGVICADDEAANGNSIIEKPPPIGDSFTSLNMEYYHDTKQLWKKLACKLSTATRRVPEFNLNCRDHLNQTPLSLAAAGGHYAVVAVLLNIAEVEIDSRDDNDRTPLWRAASVGSVQVAKLLLETGKVDPDCRDSYNETPLQQAVIYGHEEVVRLLLKTGVVDLHGRDRFGRTLLHLAIIQRHEAVANILIETKNFDLNSKDHWGQTPLRLAAAHRCGATVRLLLDTDSVDINCADYQGRTPLSLAAGNGYETITRLLIEKDETELNSKDRLDQTSLWWAATQGHASIVKLLLETPGVDSEYIWDLDTLKANSLED
ncbi:ankyrin, putative [Talaromyces stipitatus ATCC 10500]|uniref:Ankyrin, putative n=1 Tax=Talaromyces stipitatus (strain ATCC 10500 / CBS 375.48 / QM 6759 / NRRL 1006) TaxID=441959 RepID=B8MU50_TALSN|nr:ankyrin, putative [Talaromyces stipitatus ATCC 10500]EED11768.1 ankyrin, putative [Talaromyces stipitatus ATCC 10500]